VAHNNVENGISSWQNNRDLHDLTNFVGYRNGRRGITHGAYQNQYHYKNLVLTDNGGATFGFVAIESFAQSDDSPNHHLVFENVKSNGLFHSGHHVVPVSPDRGYALVKNCTFSSIRYNEIGLGSFIRYEDCNLIPANFTMTKVHATTLIDIYQNGVRTYHWVAGAFVNG
jgi:hypothetical protein